MGPDPPSVTVAGAREEAEPAASSPSQSPAGPGNLVPMEERTQPPPWSSVAAMRRPSPRRPGADGNARLTASVGMVLLVLLAIEGLTILAIRPLLPWHIFVGMLLVPPVLLKIGSTSWRIVRYYLVDQEYVRRGPPIFLLRAMGPLVVASTVAVIGTGLTLVLVAASWRPELLFWHKASFVLWFGIMAVHVLAHISEAVQVSARDWLRRAGDRALGIGARRAALVVSLVVGLLLGALLLPTSAGFPLGLGG